MVGGRRWLRRGVYVETLADFCKGVLEVMARSVGVEGFCVGGDFVVGAEVFGSVAEFSF